MSVDPNTNHITGVYGLTYDANGNQSGYNYDVENRISSILQGESYVYYRYDAQNRRIFSWASTLDSMNNQNVYTVYYYTPAGQKLGAYQFNIVQTSTPTLYVTLMTSDRYFGSKRLAPQDRLGSAGDFYPWGEAKGGNNPQDTWSYATYWRDSASGLDYANNRYYSNAYGRFMTPDPYQASGGPSDPQSWNRYAYTRGDPVNRADPAGTCDLTISFLGFDDGWFGYTSCDASLGPDFNPAAYAVCLATPGCYQPLSGGGGNPSLNTAGPAPPGAVANVQPLNTPLFGQLASALANTGCGQWFQAGLTTSGVGVSPGQSLSDYLTETLPSYTGSAVFIGGNANAIQGAGALAPGYPILFNQLGAFFNAIPNGQTIGYTNQYASQFASIQGGSPQAQVFLMLHEIAHMFGMIRDDNTRNTAQNAVNQAFNNDEIWLNCSSVIQSFSNTGPSQ